MSNQPSSQVEYEEIQSAPIWTYLIGVIVVVAILVILWFASTTAPISIYLWILCISLLILLAFIFLTFSRMKVRITNDELDISYGLFHHRIPRSAIKAVTDIDLKFTNTGGIGIRVSLLGYTVYNSRWGKGIRIDRNDGGKSVGFSADNPEQIKQMLLPKNF
ncbi:DUF3093 family protein [Patescibacteria group bacterium]